MWEKLAGKFILNCFLGLSPELKKTIDTVVINLHDQAIKTSNPIDDLFTGALCFILGVKKTDD